MCFILLNGVFILVRLTVEWLCGDGLKKTNQLGIFSSWRGTNQMGQTTLNNKS